MRARGPLALGLLLGALSGCEAGEGDSSGVCDRMPPLTYDNFGQGLMDQHCTGCHSSLVPEDHREAAPVGVDFDTYEGVLTWAERIHARAVPDGSTMPPGGGPSEDQRDLLGEWLECVVIPEAERWRAEQ